MTPQWNKVKGGKKVEASPAIYRAMVDAAWKGLVKTGHRHDTIMIGETAAYGAGHKGYAREHGSADLRARLLLPERALHAAHGHGGDADRVPEIRQPRRASCTPIPALFDAAGWAHHPYDFVHPPSFKRSDPNSATLSGISRLEKALDRSARAYHQRAGKPIDITEWGVQSRQPSPYVEFSPSRSRRSTSTRASTWRGTTPRVPSFAQFLLVDDAPNTQYKKGSRAYWATFQSGLLTYPFDQPKPAYYAFELPIWLPHPKHGANVLVWGQVRPPSPQTAVLQFKPRGSSGWENVATVKGTEPEGFFTTHVQLPSAGAVRISWSGPGVSYTSRVAPVS